MLKKIIYIACIVLIFFAILWYADSSFNKFGNDIELQNPLEVFNIDLPEIGNETIDVPELDEPDINIPDINKPDVDIPEVNGPDIPEITEPEIPSIEEPTIPEIEEINLPSIKTKEEVDKLISSIRVSSDNKKEGYERDKFEKPTKYFYIDKTRYTRNKYAWHVSDYLISEEPFEYICPYTGLTIIDMSMIDFEHIVSLKTTYENCPEWWTDKEMNEYAYDQLIGVDVLNTANRSKGAKTPSEWLPDKNAGDFCFTYVAICQKYDLSMSKTDLAVCKLEIYNTLDSRGEVKFINQFKENTEEYQRQLKWYEDIKNL